MERPSDEVLREVREWECHCNGHEVEVINVVSDDKSLAVVCRHCMVTWSLAPMDERDRPREALERLLNMILVDMRAATNRDLASDGDVGDEEGEVWRQIEDYARTTRSALSAGGDG